MYNVQFSIQLAGDDTALQYADVWFRKNGNDIPRSATDIGIDYQTETVPAWNYVTSMDAGDYFEIMVSSTMTDVYSLAIPGRTGPDRPAVPSVILTVLKEFKE